MAAARVIDWMADFTPAYTPMPLGSVLRLEPEPWLMITPPPFR